MNYFQKNIEPLLHVIFWILPLAISLSITSQVFPPRKAVLLSSSNIAIMSALSYTNICIVIPYFFQKRKFGIYISAIVSLITIAIFINTILFGSIFFESSSTLSPLIKRRMEIHQKFPALRVMPTFFMSLIFLFISTVYQLAKDFKKKEHHSEILEKEKIKHELKFLRSQINPHFLLNALNNIHATVHLKPDKTGDFILKLGDMLRYVLEDCNKEKVQLTDEIKYIQNYIFFQKEKDEKLKNITFKSSENNISDFLIEPMLLIPLVENAFQHNTLEKIENQWVIIKLTIKEEQLEFKIANNIGTQKKGANFTLRNKTGVGLKNIERRLKLLYPNKHQLTYKTKKNEFQAILVIQKTAL